MTAPPDITVLANCPWCSEIPGVPFDNLVDRYVHESGEEEPVKVWTIGHDCPVIKTRIWVEGDTEAECAANWNTRRSGGSAPIASTAEAPSAAQCEEIISEVQETSSPMPHVYRQGWQDACEKVRSEIYRRLGRVDGLVREVVVVGSADPKAFNAGIVAAADKVRACIDDWRLHGSIDEYGIDLLATAENSIRALKAEGDATEPELASTARPEGANNPSLREEMVEALRKITRTPSMPFPDPGAHSWQAWGLAVHRAWREIQGIASTALKSSEGSPTRERVQKYPRHITET